MSPSRRTFAAAVVAALAGCAGAGRDRQDRAGTDGRTPDGTTAREGNGTDGEAGERVPNPQSGAFQDPFGPWIPDLTVVNHNTDGMTAYVSVQDVTWAVPTFEETISIRGRPPGREPVSASVTRVDARSPRSVLLVQTADGRRGRHPYRGGGPERGVVVHVHPDAVAFERASL